MSKQIDRRSIMDYKPKTEMPVFTPQTDTKQAPAPEQQKQTRKRNLYSSAQPPAEF